MSFASVSPHLAVEELDENTDPDLFQQVRSATTPPPPAVAGVVGAVTTYRFKIVFLTADEVDELSARVAIDEAERDGYVSWGDIKSVSGP